MSTATAMIEALANREYKWGFVTDIESDVVPRGLNEATRAHLDQLLLTRLQPGPLGEERS